MIRVSILYPKKDNVRFDLDYYVKKHMPLSIKLLAPSLRGVSVEQGLDVPAPGVSLAFVAATHFLFDSVEAFVAAFTPHAAALQGDMSNYTDIVPIIQFSQVMLSHSHGELQAPRLVETPTVIAAAGTKPKIIREHVGRVNTKTAELSIAHMTSPSGWEEPGQTPEFDEYTVVLKGALTVVSKSGTLKVNAGQAVMTPAGTWVRYSTPDPEGAEYIAVCLPAFAPETVKRDV